MTWSEKRLDELGTISRGRSRHRPRDAAHLYGGPYPFVQTGDIKRADLYLTQFSQTYSAAGLAQSRLWPTNTLCITIAANIAETAVLGIDACFPDSVIGFTADESKCDVRFIKYLFDTIKERYQQVSRGAAQENLSQEKLLSFSVTVPSVEIQRQIANVLSAYDRAIENNRRRMALLKEAARQLYQEWFVRLRFPGHEHARFINGVPDGWLQADLEAACVPKTGFQTGPFGSQLHQSDYCDDGVPVVMPKDILGARVIEDTIARVPDDICQRLSRHMLKRGDIVLARRGDIGRKAFVTEREDGWLCGTGCMRLRPNAEIVAPRLLFETIGRADVMGTIVGRAQGAIMPNLNLDILANVPIVLPPLPLQRLFIEFVGPIHRQIGIVAAQNEQLKLARDILLPRLMSGEIEV